MRGLLARVLIAEVAHSPFVSDLTVVLVVAALTSVAFRLLRQSSVLGYLLAGLIVGPYIPVPLFADPSRISQLAEFGVILVMFSVGTEFNLRRLLALLLRTGFAATVQMTTLAWLGYVFGEAIGLGPTGRLFLGCSLAISSTMVVAKVYDEHEPERQVRELVFGILVIQDIAAVVLIAVLTAAARGASITADGLGTTVLEVVGVLVALIVVGLFVVPRFIRMVGRLGSREHMVVSGAALAFGLAGVAQALGYSVALGAFLAGMLASESGRAHDIEHVVTPIRDLFAAVFFVSVGMSVDPAAALHELPISIPLAFLVVFAQLVVVASASVLSGNGLRRSLLAGAALGQIGEFAFIMVGVGAAAGVIGPSLYPVVVTVAVVTAFTTPLMVRLVDRWAPSLDRRLPHQLRAALCLYESWLERLREQGVGQAVRSRLQRRLSVLLIDGVAIVVIVLLDAQFADEVTTWLSANFGASERLAKGLAILAGAATAIPFLVSAVGNARRVGADIGESLLPFPQAHAPDLGRAPRRLLTVTFQLVVLASFALPVVTVAAPFVPQFVTAPVVIVGAVVMAVYLWRTANDLGGHVKAASQVVLELLKAQTNTAAPAPDVATLLPGLNALASLRVASHSSAAGQTLQQVDLSARTGAAILAIYRPNGDMVTPDPTTVLATDDIVGVVGTDEAVAAARQLLEVQAAHG